MPGVSNRPKALASCTIVGLEAPWCVPSDLMCGVCQSRGSRLCTFGTLFVEGDCTPEEEMPSASHFLRAQRTGKRQYCGLESPLVCVI